MSNIIEELFYGNLEPQECSSELTAEMKKKLSQLTKKEECLNEKLADELKDLFADYTSSCTAFTSVCCADSFMVGFRLGARFAYDTFVENRKG